MTTLIRLLSRVLALLPLRAAMRFGRGCGWLLGTAFRYRRREALTALQRSFPEKSPEALRRILDDMYGHLGMTVMEMARMSVQGQAEVEGRVRFHGAEHIAEPARSRAGAMLILMGHIGNWEVLAWTTRIVPSPFHVVVKPMRSRALERHVTEIRRDVMNMIVLPFRGSYRRVLAIAQSQGTVAVILDQYARRSVGVTVNFFGRPASTSPGLAILSARTRLPVYPLFDVLREDFTHDIFLLPPIPPPPDRRHATLREYTQRYTTVLEEIIREHPEQWIWIHRRWKGSSEPVSGSAPA